jgi:hypothetical protein
MAEEWELKQLERRVDSIEKGLREEKDRAQKEKWRRTDLRMNVLLAVFWTLYVAALTTMIVLAASGHLHHH